MSKISYETKIREIVDEFANVISKPANTKQLYIEKNIFLNEKVKPLLKQIKEFSNFDQRKEFGEFYNLLNNKIEDVFNKRLSEFVKKSLQDHSSEFDSNLDSTDLSNGSVHPLNVIITEILSFFEHFNFDIHFGNEIVSVVDNFDILNVPKNHVSRDPNDSFFINENTLLRSQCTATTASLVKKMPKDDVRVVTYGNVYRNDTDDSTHNHQFMQLDFMWLKNTLTVANLKWFMNEFIQHIFGKGIKERFRLSFFPFTEPSFEIDVACWNCTDGCSLCKYSKWIEVLGCGMLHPNVIKKISPLQGMRGIAGGIGIERIAMLKYSISDIRDFYTNDFRFLNQFGKRQ